MEFGCERHFKNAEATFGEQNFGLKMLRIRVNVDFRN